MAGVTGLEPAASGVTGQRSNQLSYTPALARGLRQGVGQVKPHSPGKPSYRRKAKSKMKSPRFTNRPGRIGPRGIDLIET